MLLSVKNLKVQFKHDGESIKAVDGIDFAIGENEVVGLVGESGSGKTITALSLMRLLPKKDCIVTEEITGKARLAMIFQEPFTSLNPVFRAGEQVDEAILAHENIPKKEAKERTLALFRKTKLHDPERIYDSYPHQLSGGERQRVMAAMALSLNPEILIADEPTTALDVTVQSEIIELILGLKEEFKMSILFITHDFGIINKVADRVLVMKDGKIAEEGTKNEVLSAPKNNYTKALLASVPKIVYGDRSLHDTMPDNETCPRRDRGTHDIITVKGLNKSFYREQGIFKKKGDAVHAVKNVNLRVRVGTTLGIVGESGSGKTTLGKLMIGLLKPDSGTVAMEREGQIVFQDPRGSLDPRMRMLDIVLEGPVIRKIKRKEKEEVLRDVLFKTRLNYKERLKFPHQFSGGQRQRIAIARALAVNPRILILDEPVSSLDVIIQSDILGLLKELQKEFSLTYIFISHDLRVVSKLADDVCVMHKGEIVEYGSKQQIFTSPKHQYTKKLLASVL